MLLIDPNNAQKHKHVRPNLSNYPKLDPFQAISLANGLRRTCSANKLGSIKRALKIVFKQNSTWGVLWHETLKRWELCNRKAETRYKIQDSSFFQMDCNVQYIYSAFVVLNPSAEVKEHVDTVVVKVWKLYYINPKGKFILSPQEQRQRPRFKVLSERLSPEFDM